MTYCVAIKVDAGIVCLADTRTNAGLDNISKFKKLFTWTKPGERAVTMMTAGNLAITQAVMNLLQENVDKAVDGIETVYTAPTMFRLAEIVGDAMRIVQNRYGPGLNARGEDTTASIIVAGQRSGGPLRIFLVYAAGNFIEATPDTPYFQIGEHKYGKPIIDRVTKADMPLEDVQKLALLSMDSTLRSNLSAGMPLDMTVLPAGQYAFSKERRIEWSDADYQAISTQWSDYLSRAFNDIPCEE